MNSISDATEQELRALSKDQAELLKLLLERKAKQAHQIRHYLRDARDGRVQMPTSWAQQRLWFIDQLGSESATYHIAEAIRVRGELNCMALRRALEALIERHEVLRTVFVECGGVPVQQVERHPRLTFKEVDLSGCGESERATQLHIQKQEEAFGTFDLTRGPLIRTRLIRLQSIDHVLLFTMHHIISDGWSMGIFVRELSELYKAFHERRSPSLAPLSIQYADYAQWQRKWLTGPLLEKQLTYWRTQLKGAPPQIDLPTDRPRPALQSYRGDRMAVTLDADLCVKLKELAQREHVTLFMVLCAGWAILLSRLSGEEDVVIGTPVANRQRPELERLIGFFVNTLALRTQVHGKLRVQEFLHQVRDLTLQAYDHQDVPFEQVVQALQPERNLGRNPLFQVMLVLLNVPQSALQLPGLTVLPDEEVYGSSKFDMQLVLEERGQQISGGLTYSTDLFDRSTVQRWMACFSVLLGELIVDTSRHIGELSILPESERQQVLQRFNATQAEYPQEKLIHELFEEQVRRTPEAVAVVYEAESVSYAQLNARANQLARYLRGQGVGPDQLVGICVERSVEMVVGLLGILKAGGAYVPLDPAYPVERLGYMLADGAPRVLLTQQRLRGLLPQTSAQVLALDEDWSEIAREEGDDLPARLLGLHARHLAYVIYTSGSTGQPKGAMNEHRGVVNRLLWMQDRYRLDHEGRVLQKTPFSFDVSVWEFFLDAAERGAFNRGPA